MPTRVLTPFVLPCLDRLPEPFRPQQREVPATPETCSQRANVPVTLREAPRVYLVRFAIASSSIASAAVGSFVVAADNQVSSPDRPPQRAVSKAAPLRGQRCRDLEDSLGINLRLD